MLIKISKKEIIKLMGKEISDIFMDYYHIPLDIHAYKLSIKMIDNNVIISWKDDFVYWDYPFERLKVKINHRNISFTLERKKLFI